MSTLVAKFVSRAEQEAYLKIIVVEYITTSTSTATYLDVRSINGESFPITARRGKIIENLTHSHLKMTFLLSFSPTRKRTSSFGTGLDFRHSKVTVKEIFSTTIFGHNHRERCWIVCPSGAAGRVNLLTADELWW